jgi:hypothetical protein
VSPKCEGRIKASDVFYIDDDSVAMRLPGPAGGQAVPEASRAGAADPQASADPPNAGHGSPPDLNALRDMLIAGDQAPERTAPPPSVDRTGRIHTSDVTGDDLSQIPTGVFA